MIGLERLEGTIARRRASWAAVLGAAALLLLAGGGAGHAQGILGESPIEVRAGYSPEPAGPGATVAVEVQVTVEPGWAIYSMDTTGGPTPTALALFPGKNYEVLEKVEEPEPKRKRDEGFGIEVGVHSGTTVFRRWVRLADDARGTVVVRGELTAQGCSDTACLNAETLPFSVPIEVEPGAGGAAAGQAEEQGQQPPPLAPAGAGAPEAEPGPMVAGVPGPLMNARIIATSGMERDEQEFLAFLRGTGRAGERPEGAGGERQGLLWVLLAGLLSGVVALATPCVYPMIPITVSFFTGLAENRKGSSLAPALVYCAGIVASFTLLGLVLTLALGASGVQRFGTSPWVNGAVGILFVIFAAWLFGMFELRLPRGIAALGGASATRKGYASVLLMGLTFAVTSFACTGPFIGTILVGAATQGYLAPTFGMIGFSLALSVPFFFLALLPQLAAKLPRSGGWLVSVKVVMGFLVLAVAIKFLATADAALGWGILPRTAVLAAFMAVALAAALYLLGVFSLRDEEAKKGVSAGRMLLAVVFLAAAVRMVPALLGGSLGELDAWLPQDDSAGPLVAGAADAGGRIPWMSDLDLAVRVAREQEKPLFLEFTGHTCGNCKWMKANMFSRPAVVEAFSAYVPVELYTDRLGDPAEARNREFREAKFRSVALPLYAIVELP